MLFTQVALNGILLGGLYACMAMSFSLIWGVMNIINLAHGSMMLLGSYVTFSLFAHFGIDPILSLPFAAAVLFVFGFALQHFVFNRVLMRSVYLTLILTFGLDMLLINFNVAVSPPTYGRSRPGMLARRSKSAVCGWPTHESWSFCWRFS